MITIPSTQLQARIALINAPSNLGLRPPVPGSVPGTAKAPEALREAGLHDRLARAGARDAGVVLPARYRDDLCPGSNRLRNQDAILAYTHRLADRLEHCLDAGDSPLLLGGDCSILIAVGLALSRRGTYGLVHLDGHTDFRHPGNSDACGSLAGEDLAAAIGVHWDAISDIEQRRPYFHPSNSVHAGCRPDDEHLEEASARLALTVPAPEIRELGPKAAAGKVLEVVDRVALAGFWIHLDVDVLDPTVISSVDSPDPGGLSAEELTTILSILAPRATGANVTIFDPDLDPDGTDAYFLTVLLADSFARLGAGIP